MVDFDPEPTKTVRDVDISALPQGAKIGRYEVVSVLGQGGFGITYRALDRQLGREVAIKEYLPTSLAYREDGITVMPRSTRVAEDFTWGRDRFVAEGRTLATLHQAPGIVRVHDFLEINGTAYIVMEMLRGDTLEGHIKTHGPMDAAAIERVLWPLLDGLEQVHAAGFLHRDIKPANILLGAKGQPTLIDFGASRAAMAGRTTAMTAIFTPGYAAAEQFTSAKQGPWTDIYGLSATLYHVITGGPPPSAFDRMLDDTYESLGNLQPVGFMRGILVGIDAGLAVRSSERPQSIAGWRPILAQASAGSDVTVVSKPALASAHAAVPPPAARRDIGSAARRPKTALLIGAAVAALLAAGGSLYLALAPSRPSTPPIVADTTAGRGRLEQNVERARAALATAEQAAAREAEEETKRKAVQEAADKVKAQEEARLKAEAMAKRKADAQTKTADEASAKADADAKAAADAKAKADADAALKAEAAAAERLKAQQEIQKARDELATAEAARRQAEAETASLKAEAEAIARRRADALAKTADEARAKADAEAKVAADAKAKVDTDAADKKAAEATEAALRLAPLDRQHVQVALTSSGFDTRGSDGVFGPRSREMIAAWQKTRNQPSTSFLTGTQNQALLKEATPAVTKYDADQKRIEDDKKKAEDDAKKKADEEAKAKAAAPPAATVPATPVPPTATSKPLAAAAAAGGGGFDGTFQGTLTFSATPTPWQQPLVLRVSNGTGFGGATNAGCGALSISISISQAGDITGAYNGYKSFGSGGDCTKNTYAVKGHATAQRLQLELNPALLGSPRGTGTLMLQ